MSGLLLPRSYTPELVTPGKKPSGPVEIDWSYPSAQGLKYCYLMTGGGADSIVNLVDNRPANRVAPNGNLQKVNKYANEGAVSENLAASSTGDHWVCSAPYRIRADVGLTLLTRSRISAPNKYQYAALGYTGSNTQDLLRLRYGYDSSATLDGRWRGLSALTSVTDFDWHTFGATIPQNNMWRFMLDGVFDEPVQTRIVSNEFFTPDLIGAKTNGGDFRGQISYVMAWERSMSDAEMQSLRHDPYQFLKPANAPRYYPALISDSGVSGTGIIGLAPMGVAGGTSVGVSASATLSFDALLSALSVVLPVSGVSAPTLVGSGLGATGSSLVLASAALTLGPFAGVSAGSAPIAGQASVTFPTGVVGVATTVPVISGSAAPVLADFSSLGQGQPAVGGALLQSLDACQITATGAGVIAGVGAFSLPLGVAGVAALASTTAGAVVQDALQVVGTVQAHSIGQGALGFATWGVSGAALTRVNAVAALSFSGWGLSAQAGSFGLSGAVVLSDVQLVASGVGKRDATKRVSVESRTIQYSVECETRRIRV